MREKINRLVKIDFIRFGMVGAVGFVVTASALHFFHVTLNLGIIVATLISSEIGLLSNFVFHENWTYKYVNHKTKPLWKKLLHFHMSSWSGVILITVIESVGVKLFHLNYIVALVIASGITMFWNFFWTKFFIFKGHSPDILMHPEETVPERKI